MQVCFKKYWMPLMAVCVAYSKVMHHSRGLALVHSCSLHKPSHRVKLTRVPMTAMMKDKMTMAILLTTSTLSPSFNCRKMLIWRLVKKMKKRSIVNVLSCIAMMIMHGKNVVLAKWRSWKINWLVCTVTVQHSSEHVQYLLCCRYIMIIKCITFCFFRIVEILFQSVSLAKFVMKQISAWC